MRFVYTYSKSDKKGGFSNTRVSDKEKFEEVVAIEKMIG